MTLHPRATLDQAAGRLWILLCALFFILFLGSGPALAQQHRATHLGNPATRFAEPLETPDDLRRVFLAEPLQEDIAKILRMSGFLGDIGDFRAAVASAAVNELSIAPGTLLPAMSTRVDGQPALLREVLWAGKEAFGAFEFFFNSRGRRYRAVVPKPCSNLWVEEQPGPQLSIGCELPFEVLTGRSVSLCNNVDNLGQGTESSATVALTIPPDTELLDAATPATVLQDSVTWALNDLAPRTRYRLCATFAPKRFGLHTFDSTVVGELTPRIWSRCQTRVYGIPAIQLEVIDLTDPVLVGEEAVYTIRVLNQGSEPLTNIHITGTLEASQVFQSGSGATEVKGDAASFAPAVLPRLEPKQEVLWRIVVQAAKPGDVRFNIELRADQFTRPVTETESTMQY